MLSSQPWLTLRVFPAWSELRGRWLNLPVGEGLLRPSYFAVGTRWITWFVALGIIALGAASDRNLNNGWPLLAATGLQLLVVSCYIPWLSPRLPKLSRWFENTPWLYILDVAWSLLVIHLSGGWGSPFYLFALNSVLPPSLRYRLRGATIASFGFSLSYLIVLLLTEPGFEAFFQDDGRLHSSAVSGPINPFMVSFFAALLAEVLDRLEQEKAKVRELAAQEERYRLAREIHDGVAQTLFMLNLTLDACAEFARREQFDRVAEKLPGLVLVSRQSLWEVRNAMFDPEPLLRGGAPLSEALSRLFREYEAVSQTAVEVKFEGVERPLLAAQRVALYRILQESLANSCKHSGADCVKVRIVFGLDETRLVVEDNGIGFEPSTVRRGRGLGHLQSRAAEAGGRLQLSSELGVGTRVAFAVPNTMGDSP